MAAQIKNTRIVAGTVRAQYNENVWPQENEGTLKSAAKNVAGRNSIVIIAIVFIAAPSSFVAAAMSRLVSANLTVVSDNSSVVFANLMFVMESSCVKSAMSYHVRLVL